MNLLQIKTNKIIFLTTLIFLLSACSAASEILPSETEDQSSSIEEIPAAAVETLDVTEALPESNQEEESLDNPPNDLMEDAVEPTAAIESPATRFPASKYEDLEIVTLLPPDAIPAIDDPQFLPVAAADAVYDPDELVLGVSFNGDSRAYSVPFLSNHEIVNDNVAGVKIAVTW